MGDDSVMRMVVLLLSLNVSCTGIAMRIGVLAKIIRGNYAIAKNTMYAIFFVCVLLAFAVAGKKDESTE